MKRKSSARRWRQDDRAVANVVGAILVVAIGVTTLVNIKVNFVPEWEREREAALTRDLQNQLRELNAALIATSVNASSHIEVPLVLKTASSSALAGTSFPATLQFGQDTKTSSIRSGLFRLVSRDGQGTNILPEDWKPVTAGGATITDVLSLENVRLRLYNVTNKADDRATILRLKDSGDKTVGTFTTYVKRVASETWVFRQSVDASGKVLFDQGEQFKLRGRNAVETFWVDILEPEVRFRDVLAQAPRPFKVEFIDDGLGAEYTISYRKATAQGSVLVGVGGILLPNWNQPASAVSFHLGTRNAYFVNQDFWLENGAVLLEQAGGATFLVPPPFQVSSSAGVTLIEMTRATVFGKSNSLGSTSSLLVRATQASATTIVGQAANLTLEVYTRNSTLYTTFWAQQLANAGLTSTGCTPTPGPSCHYQTSTGVDPDTNVAWARLTVHGFTVANPNPNDVTQDVQLSLLDRTFNVLFVQ